MANASDLAKKLNLKDRMTLHVFGKPDDVDLAGLSVTESGDSDAVLVFTRTLADVDRNGGPMIEAARQDRIAWVAYPKAGQLGTDLNRDILWRRLQPHGIQGVRQVSLSDVWSAMRFRPQK